MQTKQGLARKYRLFGTSTSAQPQSVAGPMYFAGGAVISGDLNQSWSDLEAVHRREADLAERLPQASQVQPSRHKGKNEVATMCDFDVISHAKLISILINL
jgi:hypothetical protein